MRKVPKLRFKEFTDEWEEKSYKDIFKINQGLQIAINERFLEPANNRMFYITNEFLKKDSKIKYYIENPPLNVICSKDDILMTRTGNTGQVVTNVEGAFHNNFFKINYSKEKFNKYFICLLLKSNKIQKTILKLAGTSTIPDLNHSDFYRIKSIIPSIKEQEKIANFLSSVDKKISLTEEKLELFKKYKKGVMQKIFSQELRFKDNEGNDYPEWEEKRLGEISEVKDGTHDSPKYINNGFPLVTSKNIKNGKIDLDEVNYISKEDYDNINKRSKVSKGDILMGMIGTIGNLSIADREGFAIKNVALIKEKSDLKNNFLIYLLQSDIFYKKIALLNEGGTQKFISLSNIRNLLFFIPTLEEQQKIADFLSSIDSKIEKIEKELENLKEFKKGLLQQMFV